MICLGWNLALPLAATAQAESTSTYVEPAGRIESPELSELSGLAVSRRVAGRWWGLNDSGHAPVLYAFAADGRGQGEVTLGILNTDWEDLASYSDRDGRAYLAIADTGDNFSFRSFVSIWVLPEPELPAKAGELPVPREIRFRFEDGPRDCEALAADPARQRFLLVDKGRRPAGLYELPMAPPANGQVAVARRIGELPLIWSGGLPPALPAGTERYRGSATSMDLSPDGRRLLVLAYKHLAEFQRRDDEDWPQAIARGPAGILRIPPLRIAEALGYDAQAHQALIGGEAVHTPLLRWLGRFPPALPDTAR